MCEQLRIHPVGFKRVSHRRERGVVLVIALIILAAMTLAAVGLVRSVETSTLLARNISFKRDALNRSEIGFAAAMNTLQSGFVSVGTTGSIPNVSFLTSASATQTANNYSPILLNTNTEGIPVVMTSATTFASSYPLKAVDNVDGMTVYYLIERMCTKFEEANVSHCRVTEPPNFGGTQDRDKNLATPSPYFRVTVRTDGPRGSSAFAQSIMSLRSTTGS